jgi:hypothetical protein
MGDKPASSVVARLVNVFVFARKNSFLEAVLGVIVHAAIHDPISSGIPARRLTL